ncbi:MAG: RimK family alpha-L-glutamate ligase [Planctomycetes bacterium]|nr:RimK family alpha-L-glutamate ligase [Planctomycetota bacterium]
MQIAVLGSATSWYIADLRRAAGDRHTITPVTYRQLCSQVAQSHVTLRSDEVDLLACDVLLIRSMPPGSLEQVIFRMNALATAEAAGVRVVNSPRSIEIAVDKYLTTVRLQEAGLLVPTTVACQTAEQAMQHFESLGSEVVVKPLFGGEGRGITRVADEAIALRTFKALEQIGAVIYLQQFIEHEGYDLRLFVLGKKVLGMRRRHPSDWRTNISRGAIAEPLEVTEQLANLAHQAAAAVGTSLAGVDLLPGKDGQLYALEVNAVPGWRALAKATNTDVASKVIQWLEETPT